MPAKRQKSARSSSSSAKSAKSSLQALPQAMLQEILEWLPNRDLLQVLQTSKTMAQQVMERCAGRLNIRVQQGANLAAVRQLLQWAPPACLKLVLVGNTLNSLFSSPDNSRQDAGMQQEIPRFPCILEVYIQGFILPALVPVEIAAACPNLRMVHLHDCELVHAHPTGSSKGGSKGASKGSSDGSKHSRRSNSCGSSSSSSSRGSGKRAGNPIWQTCNLHTLALEDVGASELKTLPSANTKRTRGSQAAADFAEQLRASVPNVRCLQLCGRKPCADFIWPLLGPQLAELHVQAAVLPAINLSLHLRQLQKLVAPRFDVFKADDMDLLLSLPNLTHVELGAVYGLMKDYSSHPCKWLSLRLCLHDMQPWLCLDTLAKMPIHSVTHPLTLGTTDMRNIEVTLPDNLADLQRLAQQLMKCGVRVLPTELSFGPHTGWPSSTAQFAAALQLIASVFGPRANLQLRHVPVDQAVMQAVAAVNGDRLKQLTLPGCDLQAAWHAVLSGCPGLTSVVNTDTGCGALGKVVRSLAEAVAHQPAGRCIELTSDRPAVDSSALWVVRDYVVADSQAQLEGVDITVHNSIPASLLIRKK